mmetsp:Transcript_9962/g.28302  ORF Transcript_9962/g.28302 Transcript_9962/m.28302 type:complete len:266 (-) Transcript_9962:503-1300(-)
MQAMQPPLVLVFQIGRVRPLHDENRHFMRPASSILGVDEVGDVELRGKVGVFGFADRLVVDPHFQRRARRSDVQHHTPPRDQALMPIDPMRGQSKGAPVEPHGRLGRCTRRAWWAPDRKADIRVLRSAKALELPVAWHLDAAPTVPSRGGRCRRLGRLQQTTGLSGFLLILHAPRAVSDWKPDIAVVRVPKMPRAREGGLPGTKVQVGRCCLGGPRGTGLIDGSSHGRRQRRCGAVQGCKETKRRVGREPMGTSDLWILPPSQWL